MPESAGKALKSGIINLNIKVTIVIDYNLNKTRLPETNDKQK